MRAVMYPGGSSAQLVEVPVPAPGPGQVLIRMRASGICGSELHFIYQVSREAKARSSMHGVIPGHEPCGQIEATGAGVQGFAAGDRVVVYHISGCGTCKYCRAGWMLHCQVNKHTYGVDINGGHADYMVADARNCIRLPQELSFADGAHCACGGGTAYQALLRLGISGRDRLAVFGLGPVGLGGVILAKALGATVYACDIIPERVALARQLGADIAFNAGEADALQYLLELSGGEGVEAAVDFSASPQARIQALKCVGIWGRVAFVGEGNQTTIEPSPMMLHRQLTVIGSWVCGLWQMEELTRLMARKHISFEPMITHKYALGDVKEAIDTFTGGHTGKVMLVWD
ncbi:MAG: alcohol dehydrogenase catalytic domain-containing protein [Anaerolineae bacterium]